MTELGSAPVPGVGDEDHVRGPSGAPLLIEYGDFQCPFCAVLHQRLLQHRLRYAFRHFPVRSSHPRAWAAACAAEAAGLQGRFWEMHDSLFVDQGRLDDPHLWRRAQGLELDLDRFEADRHSEVVRTRVRSDFESGVRAGVVTTPTVFAGGRMHAGRLDSTLLQRLAGGGE